MKGLKNYEAAKQGTTSKLRNFLLAGVGTLCLAVCAPTFAQQLYNNGPTNGTNDAYFLDVYSVSNSFAPISNGRMTSFDVALWTPAGATPLTVDWAVGSSSLGSDIGSGGGPWSSVNLLCRNGQSYNGGACGGGYGYDLYDARMDVGSLPVSAGHTYWLTLTGATDSLGGRDGWDVNSGGSLAYHNLLGAIPSESFTVNGNSTTTTTTTTGSAPEPSSWMLLGSGVLGLTTVVRRRRLRD